MKTTKERLEELMDIVVDDLIATGKGLEAKLTASDKAVARMILRDNGIFVPIVPGECDLPEPGEEEDDDNVLPFRVVHE